MLKKRIAGLSGASALFVGMAVFGLALPAHAGNLHAYDLANYGTELVSAPSAAVIDVADDQTSSVKNFTSNTFSGRDTQGLVSFEIFSFSAGSATASLGKGIDNNIDHFDRV